MTPRCASGDGDACLWKAGSGPGKKPSCLAGWLRAPASSAAAAQGRRRARCVSRAHASELCSEAGRRPCCPALELALTLSSPCSPCCCATPADVHPDAPAGWCQEAQEEDLHQAQEAEAQVREGCWVGVRLRHWGAKCLGPSGIPAIDCYHGCRRRRRRRRRCCRLSRPRQLRWLHAAALHPHLAGWEESIVSVNPPSGPARGEERSI